MATDEIKARIEEAKQDFFRAVDDIVSEVKDVLGVAPAAPAPVTPAVEPTVEPEAGVNTSQQDIIEPDPTEEASSDTSSTTPSDSTAPPVVTELAPPVVPTEPDTTGL
jgi:hypothetical protein